MFRRVFCSFSVFSAAVALAGCGGGDEWSADRPKPVPVSGIVLYKQQPVAGATVVFHPEGHAHAATGQTDAAGKFQLQTLKPNDGAVPGEYKVTVRKVEVQAGAEEEMTQVDDTSSPEQRSLLPDHYGGTESTDLTASVTEGGANNFEFELKD
jgi:hypothetical protein